MSAANAEKILIVGTGTMGEGIAQTFAQNGFDVRLVARREEPLARALSQIRQNVKQFIEFDLIHETVDQVVARIEGMVTTDMAQAVEGCSYVVETIREMLDDKRALIGAIQAANPNVVIGSNTGQHDGGFPGRGHAQSRTTSSASTTSTPRTSSPWSRSIAAARRSDATFEQTERLMEASGKKTVLVRKEMPGFIVNRVMGAINGRSTIILDEGICTPEDLNIAVKSSTGFRFACLGPMEVDDMIGLDICRDGVGPGLQGSEQRDRAVADAGGEGREGRIGHQVGQGLVRLQRQDARGSARREEPQAAAAAQAVHEPRLRREQLREEVRCSI